MIYVVKDDQVLNKIDAWAPNAEEQMRSWISGHGYVLTNVEITPLMGNMIMTVF